MLLVALKYASNPTCLERLLELEPAIKKPCIQGTHQEFYNNLSAADKRKADEIYQLCTA